MYSRFIAEYLHYKNICLIKGINALFHCIVTSSVICEDYHRPGLDIYVVPVHLLSNVTSSRGRS